MNQRERVVVAALAVVCSCDVTHGEPAVASAATSSLTQANPGLQAYFDGERLVGLSGATMATNVTAAATADFVGAFIQQNAAAFGVPELEFALERTVSVGEGQDIIYTYHQVIEGLPVYGTVVKIPVFIGAPESIDHVALRLVKRPTAGLPGDLLSPGDATAVVHNDPLYDAFTSLGVPEKVVFETPDGALHRAWRFDGSGAGWF